MSHVTEIFLEYTPPPPCVQRIMDPRGGSCYIGEVDDTTVLKYPHDKKDMAQVRIEAKVA